MKKPGMPKFVFDYPKSKKMCKHAAKKLPFLIRYVPNQYKAQQMCDKTILENGWRVKSVPGCCKNKKYVITLPAYIRICFGMLQESRDVL